MPDGLTTLEIVMSLIITVVIPYLITRLFIAERENSKLELDKDDLVSINLEGKDKIKKLRERNEELEWKIVVNRQQNHTAKLREETLELATLEAFIQKLQTELEESNMKIRAQNWKIIELEGDLADQIQSNDHLQRECEAHFSQVPHSNMKLEKEKAKVLELQNTIQKIQESNKQMEGQLRNEITGLKMENEVLKEEYLKAQEAAEKKVQKAEKKFKKIKKEVVELEKMFHVLAAKMEDMDGAKDQ